MRVSTRATVCEGETIRKVEPQPGPDEAPTLASQGIDKKVGWSPSHRLLIRKLSIFFPFFRAATSQRGLAPLPHMQGAAVKDLAVREPKPRLVPKVDRGTFHGPL